MKKSYHSIVVPTALANATRLAWGYCLGFNSAVPDLATNVLSRRRDDVANQDTTGLPASRQPRERVLEWPRIAHPYAHDRPSTCRAAGSSNLNLVVRP